MSAHTDGDDDKKTDVKKDATWLNACYKKSVDDKCQVLIDEWIAILLKEIEQVPERLNTRKEDELCHMIDLENLDQFTDRLPFIHNFWESDLQPRLKALDITGTLIDEPNATDDRIENDEKKKKRKRTEDIEPRLYLHLYLSWK